MNRDTTTAKHDQFEAEIDHNTHTHRVSTAVCNQPLQTTKSEAVRLDLHPTDLTSNESVKRSPLWHACGGGGTALIYSRPSTRRRWVLSIPPQALYPWEGPRTGLEGYRKSRPSRIRSPDCPPRSESTESVLDQYIHHKRIIIIIIIISVALGIESRWGRDFPHPSRPAMGPQPASHTMGTGTLSPR